MKTVISIAPLLFALIMISGCSNHQAYPDNWVPLPKDPPAHCKIPTGLYVNQSEANRDFFAKLSGSVGLSKKTEHIRLSLTDDYTLTAEAVQHGEVLETKVYSQQDEEKPVCDNGWLLFKSRGWESGQAGFGYQTNVTGLLFHDGHLVVKESGSFTGWVYIMPYSGHGSDWDRFRYLGDLDLQALRDEAEQLRARGYLQ